MTRSSLTEETPATPGWVDLRVRDIFARFGERADAVRDAYADCLAGVRGAVDIDMGHDRCRIAAVAAAQDWTSDAESLDRDLQALEAELASAT